MNIHPVYTQQELDAKLLAAANALRGPVDAADFKAYIFPLLFLKRISDAWHWEYERALELYGGDEGLARLPENFRFEVPKGCLWDDVLKLHENIGAGLQLIFDRLQEANPEMLAGVFGTAQWANKQVLPEERLLLVLDIFTGLRLDPGSVTHDLLGNAYEYLLKNFADESGKRAGEFFTPRAVVRLMVQLLDPQEGESIYDPACGSGGMLVESVNQVRAHGQDPRALRLYGQEVQATTAAIARMNLYLHDIETFSIRRGDTLRDPRFREPDGSLTRFQAVIANPPFSLGLDQGAWSDDPFGRAHFGVPPRTYADLAFVEHMLESMAPRTGRLAVVVSRGVLSRRGVEREICRRIVEASLLEAVIGLPEKLFYSTQLSPAILLCRSALPADRVGAVRFVDASARFRPGRNQNELSGDDVVGILSAVHSRETSYDADGVHARSVSFDELEANGWDMTISRYVEVEAEASIEVGLAIEEYYAARSQLREAEEVLDHQLKLAGFDVAVP